MLDLIVERSDVRQVTWTRCTALFSNQLIQHSRRRLFSPVRKIRLRKNDLLSGVLRWGGCRLGFGLLWSAADSHSFHGIVAMTL